MASTDRAAQQTGGGADRYSAIVALSQSRKKDSRERLLAAAKILFCADGYSAVSVERIVEEAGVSRVTFYRHFSGKADLAVDLFRQEAAVAHKRYMVITSIDCTDSRAVRGWIAMLFDADRANRRLLRAFTQASADEEGFTLQAQGWITQIIDDFGEVVPAFALDAGKDDDRRRWLEAWLLLYEILDQSNHAAVDSGVATDPLVIDILADRFVGFVS